MLLLAKALLALAVICFSALGCEKSDPDKDAGAFDSSLIDAGLMDRIQSDVRNCTCYDDMEIYHQLMSSECVTAEIQIGCKQYPTAYQKDAIYGACYSFVENEIEGCSGLVLNANCVDCCQYPEVQAIEDYATTCKNQRIEVPVLVNDIYSGHYSVLMCLDASHGSVTETNHGTCLYIPESEFVGTATFAYFVDDTCPGEDQSTVTIEILNCADGG